MPCLFGIPFTDKKERIAMTYTKTIHAEFIDRPNRFIANVRMSRGVTETVHVKNTGRCRELLVSGRQVILACGENPARKTKYDLIAVNKPGIGLINMDSQAPNTAAYEWLKKRFPNVEIRREVTYGSSRFDLCVTDGGKTTFIEVKGVTLEKDGVAAFPDAPTEHGIKHIRELMAAKAAGYGAVILFVIQMKGISYLVPNDNTHPEFGEALREAAAVGVEVMAVDCIVTPDSMIVDGFVPVKL